MPRHDTFELRRQSDDLVYVFERVSIGGDEIAYQRQDGDFRIVYRSRLG